MNSNDNQMLILNSLFRKRRRLTTVHIFFFFILFQLITIQNNNGVVFSLQTSDFTNDLNSILNETNTNIKINFNIPGLSAVLTTLIANLIYSFLCMSLFFLCCRQITIFNSEKKRKLMEEYERNKLERKRQQQKNNNEEVIIEEEGNDNETNDTTPPLDKYPFNVMPKISTKPSFWKKLLINFKDLLKDAAITSISFFPSMLKHLKISFLSFFFTKHGDKDRKIICRKYGRDVAVYLHFQQIIIVILFGCSLLACGVLLPIHLTGNPPTYSYNMTYSDNGNSANNNGESSSVTSMMFLMRDYNGDEQGLIMDSHLMQRETRKEPTNLTQEDSFILRTTIEMVITSPLKLYAHVVVALLCFAFCLFQIYRFNSQKLVSDNLYVKQLVETDGGIPKTPILTSEKSPSALSNNENEELVIHQEGNDEIVDIDNTIVISSGYKCMDPTEIVSPFCVKLVGLPQKLTNMEEFINFVEDNLNEGKKINDENSRIQKAVLVLNFLNRINLKKVLDRVEEELDHFIYLKLMRGEEFLKLKEHIIVDEGVVSTNHVLSHYCNVSTTGSNIHLLTTDQAIDHLTKRKHKISLEIKKWDSAYYKIIGRENSPNLPETTSEEELEKEEIWQNDPISSFSVEHNNIKNSGAAYIVFKTPQDAEQVLKEYSLKPIIYNNQRILVQRVKYEPSDINWNVICKSGGITGIHYEKYFYNILLHLILVIFFIFASSPVAILSSIQSLFNVGVIENISKSTVRTFTGILGNLLFQFLPSFFLYWISRFTGIVLKKVTELGKYDSKQEYRRIYLLRQFWYSIMAVLILPSLWLTSVDGIINYLKTENDLEKMLSYMFLPSSGCLMLSTVLQFAIVSNTDDMLRLEDAFWYLWKTRFNFYRRAISPLEKLKVATNNHFNIESNYSRMLTILTLCISYGVFIPLVLPCGLLYIVIKHWCDRYLIEEIYITSQYHNPETDNLDFNLENKPHPIDYVSLQQKVKLICRIMVLSLVISCTFLLLFFTLRILPGLPNSSFLPHFIFVLFIIVALIVLLIYLLAVDQRIIKRKVLQESLADMTTDKESLTKYIKDTAFKPPFDKN
ncbi:hypothetical protein ABK040_002662 [Willaertia magna]